MNEAFLADHYVDRPSIFRAYVDNKDMGKFKCSGMLISTGTGSSGWLLSAKRITPERVQAILDIMGVGEPDPVPVSI